MSGPGSARHQHAGCLSCVCRFPVATCVYVCVCVWGGGGGGGRIVNRLITEYLLVANCVLLVGAL